MRNCIWLSKKRHKKHWFIFQTSKSHVRLGQSSARSKYFTKFVNVCKYVKCIKYLIQGNVRSSLIDYIKILFRLFKISTIFFQTRPGCHLMYWVIWMLRCDGLVVFRFLLSFSDKINSSGDLDGMLKNDIF